MISLGILDRRSAVPLHEQLAHGLRAAVLAGRVRGGDTVPSTRALAADLGVARGTVVAAYEILAGEGYLLTRPGGGTLVADVVAAPVRSEDGPARSVAAAGAALDLRPGRPGTTGLADAAWRSAWRRASAVDPAADVDDPAGALALREEIARHLARTRGLDVSPTDVIVTAGTSDAMMLALLAFEPRRGRGGDRPDRGSVRGDRRDLRVGIEDPGYPRVRMILRRLGIRAVPVPVRIGTGLDLDELESRRDLDAVIVTPHHHYPLGSRLDAEARARLLAWAAREDVVVIEDDYDSEFPHGRAPLPPLHLLDPSRVVLIGSLSKVLTPAVRCGWAVAAGEVGERLRATRGDLDLPVSLMQQHALALYLAEGALARHTARRRREYRHRRRLLIDAFADVPGISLVATDGGLHAVALLPGRGREIERAVVAALLERGVRVAPLSAYAVAGDAGVDDVVPGHARVGDAGVKNAAAGDAARDRDERADRPAETDCSSGLPAGIVFGYAEPSTVVLMEAVGAMVAVLRAFAARAA